MSAESLPMSAEKRGVATVGLHLCDGWHLTPRAERCALLLDVIPDGALLYFDVTPDGALSLAVTPDGALF